MLWLKKLLKIATPDEIELNNIRQETERLKSEIEDMQNIKSSMQSEISAIEYELKEKQAQVIDVDERLLLQEVSLYKPVYNFVNSDEYKNRIDQIREQQENLIKTDEAATGYTDWTVNNDRKAGRKMVNDTKKLLLRAFNSECEHCIEKVKYNNFDTCKKRIETARRTISKLGKIMAIDITDNYYELKIQELHLAFEYQQMKKKEKDALQLLKEQAREEAKLKKEIEEARKKIKKEQTHYKNAIASVEEKLLSTTDEQDKELLLKKLEELKEQSASVEKHIEEIDYRESNQKAGFVYVISNIGSFGEGVFKIGMTRRLDPMERVRELGDASVPFAFDVHAMIFSSDAPKLEAALHNAFSDKKVNMVNTRREFFKVSLNEIKKVIKENFDGSVDFIETADAEQFYESEQIRKELKIS